MVQSLPQNIHRHLKNIHKHFKIVIVYLSRFLEKWRMKFSKLHMVGVFLPIT